MNPIVEGSLVTGCTALVVGVVGILASICVAAKALKAGRFAQIWERRAMVYEEILADVVARRVRRDHVTSTFKFDPVTEAEISARITPSDSTAWYAFEGRVLAMASDEVHRGFEGARNAHLEVLAAIMSRREAGDDNRAFMDANPGELPPDDIAARSREIGKLQKEANTADDRLTHLIRTELLVLSASRRRLGFRRRQVRLDTARLP